MNARQRDLFLWQWSKRRRVGRTGVALRGALIGATGGLLFALILGSGMGSDGPRGFPWLLEAIGRWAALIAMSVPSFAALASALAVRVFRSHEQMYQAILRGGVVLPEQAPVVQWSDRGPAIAVVVAALLIGALVLTACLTLG